MKTLLLSTLLLLPAAGEPEPSLAAAVHLLPGLTGKARSQAVAAILKRPDANLAALVAACRARPERPPRKPGLQAVEPGWLIVPAGYDPRQPHPLLLAVGATGQDARSAARTWQRLAGGPGLLILAPKAPELGKGWTFAAADRASVTAAYAWARRHLQVDTDRVAIAGISRGGHASWGLPGLHPDLFAAAVPVAGGPRVAWAGDQNNIRYIENLAHIGVRALVGRRDDPMLVWNAEEAARRLGKLGRHCTLTVREEAGHMVSPDPAALSKWLAGRRRDPEAGRVTLATLKPARRRWLRVTTLDGKYKRAFRPRFPAKLWQSWDRFTQRRKVIDLLIKRTPTVRATLKAPGLVHLRSRGVRRLALLPGPDHTLVDAKGFLRIKVGTKGPVRRKVIPSRRILLREYARNPDPRRLVWASVEVSGERR